MNLPDKRILDFIKSQDIFTLATCSDNKPHCAICYYAYSEKLNGLIFKSSKESLHVNEGMNNNTVAAAISHSKSDISKIKGAQIEGSFTEPNELQIKEAKHSYYKKFPFALAFSGDIFLIELTKIKFVDNSFGFAKKINWVK